MHHKKSIKQLTKQGSRDVGWFDSEYLMAHALGKSREFVITNPNKKVPFLKRLFFKKYIKQRKDGVPAAHIIGLQYFFGLPFFVNKHVMVPRPGTEMMVEGVLAKIENLGSQISDCVYIDIGTGSGCIPISVTNTINNQQSTINTFATDISKQALKVAKKNAKKHNVDIKFLNGNLISPLSTFHFSRSTQIIITANLPYLIKEDVTKENPPRREPMIALDGGKNGLSLYEELLKQIKTLPQDTGYKLHFTSFFEINHPQSELIKNIILHYLPEATVTFRKDLNGENRLVRITYPQTSLHSDN